MRGVCEHSSVNTYTLWQPREGIQWRTLLYVFGGTAVSVIGMTGRNTLKWQIDTLSIHLGVGSLGGGGQIGE